MNKVPNYSSLFYFNPIPSLVYDLKTLNVLDVNEAALKHYGYTKQEFTLLTINDLYLKDEVHKLVKTHKDIENRSENIYFGVFTHVKKNGEYCRIEINGHRVDYLDFDCMLVVFRDVTEEEQQLLALQESKKVIRESETKFKTIFEIASLGIAQVDPSNGQILLINSYYETITGYSKEELLQMSFVALTHPDDRDRDWEVFTKAMHGKQEYRNTKRYVKKDGSFVWVRVHLAFIRDEDGNAIRTVAICEEITEQKIEEQRLKLLESVITNTNDAILITEAEPFDFPGPKILYVNEAFTKMTGYSYEEVIGKTPRILQGPKSDMNELAKLSKAMRKWETCDITTINYKKNGDEFWMNFSVSPVADEKGFYTHWVAIEKDVTEQKEKEIEKELLGQISLSFSFENDLITSVNELCKTIVNFGSFDIVEVWLPHVEQKHLNLISYATITSRGNDFYARSESIRTFDFDKGLPGIVWKKKSPILWDDITKDDDFIRKEAALHAGIHSALGIPLLCNTNFVGVLVIATHHDKFYLEKYVTLFNHLEQFIGSEINRKKLENDLNHLYQTIPDILCLADFKGRFLKMNKAGCKLLGFSEEEVLYQSFNAFVHQDDKETTINEVLKLENGSTTLNFENRYYTKSGELIWLSWTCTSAVEEGIIYATAKNITLEKKLRELNRMSSQLAKFGSWEIDLVGNRLFWSDIVYDLHETTPESYQPDLVTAINRYSDVYKIQVNDFVTRCIETGEPFDFEAILVTFKNNERWVRVIGNAEFINGKCHRIYGSFQDIHERKEAEVRLQTLADNLPGVVFQYLLYPDNTDKLKFVTKGSNHIWGFSPDEVIENNSLVWNQIKAGGNLEEVRQSINNAIQTKSKWTYSWKYVLPSGEIKTHLGYGSPYFLPDGTVSFHSVVLDITQEAKNEVLLEQASEMAKIGSWELDLLLQNDYALYWSPMTRAILEVDEYYNPTLTGGIELYSPESGKEIQLAVCELIEEGKEFDKELLVITKAGNEKWIRCIGKSERVRNKCIKIYGSFQDIHNSKSLEIQIREILGSISDAFYAMDKSWNFTYFNKEAENLLGKKAEDVLGKSIWELFPLATNTLIEKNYHSVASTGKPESFEYLYPGDGKWYEINAYPSQGGVSAYFKNIQERKQAAENIEKAYLEKNNIIESIADAFFTMTRNATVTYWNRAAEEILGVKREQLIGKCLWDVFPDAVSLPSYTYYNKVMETGESITFEDYYGTWLEVNAYPSEEGITVFFRDISLRKETDQRLLKAFEEKNNILERIGDAFFALDKNWIVTYWNKKAEEIIGIKREAIVGFSLWDKFPMAKELNFFKYYDQAFTSLSPIYTEEYYEPYNKWYEASGYPSPEGISFFFRDITEKKQIEEKILNANERFEKVTEATNDAIWDWDIVNNTFYRSNAIDKFFGEGTAKSLHEEDFWGDKFHPEDLIRIKKSIEQSLANSNCHRWEMQYRIFNNQGEMLHVIDRGLINRDKKGNAIRMLGAMTDITEQKNFEQRLLELNLSLKKYARDLELSNEELEQFAFIASHDLQEPLRMVSSFMDQLKRKYENQLDEKALQYIHFASDGAKRMKKIILDLLEYSRAGKFTEATETIDLNELVENYQILRRKIIQEKAVEIRMEKLPELASYKAPLTQTLHCLLDNAIYYAKKDCTPIITISKKDIGSFWEVKISDNGIGIDSQFHSKIFVIFQRLHNKEQYEGTGIGLSIAKKHVESWGGKIWLESTPGEGSSFYFTIPK